MIMEDELTESDAYSGRLKTHASNATSKAEAFPHDIAFHRSLDPDLAGDLDAFSERILSVTNKMLGLIATVDQSHSGRSKRKAKLENQDDVVDNFYSLVVDATDLLLERADICLDNVLGRNKAPAIPINLPVAEAASQKPIGHKLGGRLGRSNPVIQHAARLSKPQLLFKRKHDNSDSPWHHTLSHKYNAKVPLGFRYQDPGMESTIISDHPYQYEITHLSYPTRMFNHCTPIAPVSLEESNATWVDTPKGFEAMLAKLRNATEIAVDLEHHSYRSYAGFLCLMQISDRHEDWIIDLLAIRDEVEALNEVFTDPAIIKVFHGADSDIVWLQQDFNLYIVNMFDTFHASKLLEFPHHGLAHLLEMYCDFIPDKRYQLADWRIRPLPDEMLRYARSDTHFLLYIYDNLRNALLDKSKSGSRSASLLEEALARSAETSLKVYTKDPYDAAEGSGSGGWDSLAKKWNMVALTAGGPGVGIGGMQREVYKSVHWWRERVAREEDESTSYVLQNRSLFLMAEQPPADMATLLSLFKPTVPPLVKKRAKDLLSVITEAVKRGLSSSPVENSGSAKHAGGRIEKVSNDSKKGGNSMMVDAEVQNIERGGQTQQDLASIWRVDVKKAATSSLFGSSIPAKVSVAGASSRFGSLMTPTSSLFGGKDDVLARTRNSAGQSTFSEVVSRINRSLTMAPAVPQIIERPIEHAAETDKVPDAQEVEIPFVPSSQRLLKREEKDTIVIVGQVRQKRKRKAEKPLDSSQEISSSSKQVDVPESKTRGGLEEAQEPFDFSSVPNILDADSEAGVEEEGGGIEKRKRKQKKVNTKGGTFYGDFPAPPKAHSELKGGNKSYTFK